MNKKYVCKVCGWVYDPAENNNVVFEDLPADWVCPACGVGKADSSRHSTDGRKGKGAAKTPRLCYNMARGYVTNEKGDSGPGCGADF